MKKYKLELTTEQCNTLCAALELYGRVGLGQLEVVGEHMHHLHKNKDFIRKRFAELPVGYFYFG